MAIGFLVLGCRPTDPRGDIKILNWLDHRIQIGQIHCVSLTKLGYGFCSQWLQKYCNIQVRQWKICNAYSRRLFLYGQWGLLMGNEEQLFDYFMNSPYHHWHPSMRAWLTFPSFQLTKLYAADRGFPSMNFYLLTWEKGRGLTEISIVSIAFSVVRTVTNTMDKLSMVIIYTVT